MKLDIQTVNYEPIQIQNFEELKSEIQAKATLYKNIVYTDENISTAKTDRAALNKFIDALEKKRKQIKKECLLPYEAFERQEKELVDIISESVKAIDGQIKDYENQAKAEKREEIVRIFESKEKPKWLVLDLIWNDKWLNSSFSMKNVENEITETIAKIQSEFDSLCDIGAFAFEAQETYKTTLSVASALGTAKNLKEMRQRKEEAQAEERQAQSGRTAPVTDIAEETKETPETNASENGITRMWLKFAANVSVDEAAKLRQFLIDNHIEFKRA